MDASSFLLSWGLGMKAHWFIFGWNVVSFHPIDFFPSQIGVAQVRATWQSISVFLKIFKQEIQKGFIINFLMEVKVSYNSLFWKWTV